MRKVFFRTAGTALIAGILLIIYINILELFSYDYVNVKRDWNWVSLTIIVLIVVLSFFYLQREIRKLSWVKTLLISTLFSFVFASSIGIESYVSTKYLNPDELKSYIEEAKHNWSGRNYPPEVIESQVEHRMYAGPISFAMSSASFIFFLSFFFFGSSIFLNKLKERMNFTV